MKLITQNFKHKQFHQQDFLVKGYQRTPMMDASNNQSPSPTATTQQPTTQSQNPISNTQPPNK